MPSGEARDQISPEEVDMASTEKEAEVKKPEAAPDQDENVIQQLVPFTRNALTQKAQRKDMSGYVKLVKQLAVKGDPKMLSIWYRVLAKSVSLISPTTMPDLLRGMLSFEWFNQASPFAQYSLLLINLVTANPGFLQPVFRMLVGSLGYEPPADCTHETIELAHSRIHSVIAEILNLSPSSSTVLFPMLVQGFPHHRHKVLVLKLYLKGMLQIAETAKELQDRVITSIVERLIQIDVQIKSDEGVTEERRLIRVHKEGPGAEEDDYEERLETDEEMAERRRKANVEQADLMEKVDELMALMFAYLDLVREAPEELADQVFASLLRVFTRSVLTTHKCKHVQFLMYYFCSFRHKYAEMFLRRLLELTFDSHASEVCRHSSACYLDSFISHASYLRHPTIVVCFEHLLNWVHSYVDCHRKLCGNQGVSYVDAATHTVFYAACQAVFHIFVRRHAAFRNDEQIAERYRFGQLVWSTLNPLRFCLDHIVQGFAKVTAQTGVLDCSGLLRENSAMVAATDAPVYESQLFSYFPFDSYMLRQSRTYVDPLFLDNEGKGVGNGTSQTSADDMEADYSSDSDEFQ